jgi:hypothetical protein
MVRVVEDLASDWRFQDCLAEMGRRRLIASLAMNAKTGSGAVKPLASQEKLFSYSMIGSITTSKSSRDRPR